MTYKWIEATGVVQPDTVNLKNSVEAEFKAAFGSDLVIAPESPEGVLISVETEARDAVVRNNAELANQINPEYAGGVFLDAIAALTGLSRRAAEPSIVKAQLSGVPGSIIPAGTRAATESGDVFYSKATLVLDDQGRGDTWFYSVALDAIPAPAGALCKIVAPVLGWETITNIDPAVLGQPVESDAIFRKRRKDTLALQGVALPVAICSGVRDVPGVRSMALRENYSSAPCVIDGVEIPPHSVYAVVDGGTDEDVAQMLFTKKSLGCGWKGAIEMEVACPASEQKYLVRFDRPELVPVRVKATVRLMGASSVDYQTVVRQAIMDYAEDKLEGLRGFLVGAAVSPFDMSVAIGLANKNIFVIDLRVGLFDADVGQLKAETMELKIWQKAIIYRPAIDVVGA